MQPKKSKNLKSPEIRIPFSLMFPPLIHAFLVRFDCEQKEARWNLPHFAWISFKLNIQIYLHELFSIPIYNSVSQAFRNLMQGLLSLSFTMTFSLFHNENSPEAALKFLCLPCITSRLFIHFLSFHMIQSYPIFNLLSSHIILYYHFFLPEPVFLAYEFMFPRTVWIMVVVVLAILC